MFEVASPIPGREFERSESVVWWEQLAASTSGTTYLCKIEAPGLPADFSADTLGLAHDVADIREEGIDLSVIGSQDRISESVTAAGDAGMDLLLQRLTEYRGHSSPLEALTDRQREILETAYAMGYYDVPRGARTEDIAEDVGVDPSTVSEHLQRAERNVFDRIVGDRDRRTG